jgi:G3E family GTPase
MNKDRAHYIMIGGFLGAGKTTSIIALANKIKSQDKKVGLISNDQALNLVDTKLMESNGFEVAEIGGGCFCCKFDSLKDAALKLNKELTPDVFLAEPVGSCTDLIATVSYPLRRLYGEQFSIAPLSVLVDPKRCASMLGITQTKKFSDKVVYIYKKQLEEAEAIIINKIDRTDNDLLHKLTEEISKQFTNKKIFHISAKDGSGIEEWYQWITENEFQNPKTMDVNYKTYAEGEALLGWLNAAIDIKAKQLTDGNTFIKDLSIQTSNALENEGAKVAHYKMTLVPDNAMGEIASIHQVDSEAIPELGHQLEDPFLNAKLTVNIRAEADPEILYNVLNKVIKKQNKNELTCSIEHCEHFKPSEPVPTWRDQNLE